MSPSQPRRQHARRPRITRAPRLAPASERALWARWHTNDDDELFSVSKIARVVNVAVGTVSRRTNDGTLPATLNTRGHRQIRGGDARRVFPPRKHQAPIDDTLTVPDMLEVVRCLLVDDPAPTGAPVTVIAARIHDDGLEVDLVDAGGEQYRLVLPATLNHVLDLSG